jgi:hypothetical protein
MAKTATNQTYVLTGLSGGEISAEAPLLTHQKGITPFTPGGTTGINNPAARYKKNKQKKN